MGMSPPRWQAIAPSEFQWEREALEFIREGLPDREPFRAWSNFEFIADDGSINDVDLLVASPSGLFLVEIKSWPGVIRDDGFNWIRTHEGKIHATDNPILLANKKAKRLASLLKRQTACKSIRVPFIEPLIFCSHPEIQNQLSGSAGFGVCLRDKPETNDRSERPGIVAAIKDARYAGASPRNFSRLDSSIAKKIANGLTQAGIRPSQRARRVGDYTLGDLLYESPSGSYQEWEAQHVSINSKRRVRIYNIAKKTTDSERETILRAAKREYELLEGLSHRGILQVDTFTQHEQGPALIFRHEPQAIRLDYFLAEHASQLNVDLRLNLIRQIAEAIKYCHDKRVIHRALSPQSILVNSVKPDSPTITVFNLQFGFRESGSTTGIQHLSATLNPEQLVEDASIVYMAPEATISPESSGESLDVFSLGAIAYHIFSGQPPAPNAIELAEKLKTGHGLKISSVTDGAPGALDDLIRESTNPIVTERLSTASDFLEYLDLVEEEFTSPDQDAVKNPLEAGKGDRLEGSYIVKQRLGSGSTATAFLVEFNGEEMVLKLANKPEANDRVTQEFETLKKISFPNIVSVFHKAHISGLDGFTMEKAGDKTLARRLHEEGKLSLDMLERFGEDLLSIVAFLDDRAVQHRDIKPENLATRPMGKNNTLRLILFDFSLSQTPTENIRAGTTHYLDPFLATRQPKRWDLYAERYAAAVTLYEMATGTLPIWGDGLSNPDQLDCEVTIVPEYFDPNVSEPMRRFFQKALRRNYRQRFDNAQEMLREWRHIFEKIDGPRSRTTSEDFDLASAVESATLTTSVASLVSSVRESSALDRIHVNTVEDLLRVHLRKIYRLPGVGNQTRRNIARLASGLREKFPIEPSDISTLTTTDSDFAEPEVASVDLIAKQITKFSGKNGDDTEKQIFETYTGLRLSNEGHSFTWPSENTVAAQLHVSRKRVADLIDGARTRWRKNKSLTALRTTIADMTAAQGGAITANELTTLVLAARGSVEEEPRRSQLGSLVVRAAIEVERESDAPRFVERRSGDNLLIARSDELADYAERLGEVADELAMMEPLPAPQRVIERLREVEPPEDSELISDSRIRRLAVSASARAALSGRLEIYPRGMDSLRAIKLAHGALLGEKELTVTETRSRVSGRYPEAEPLPNRPQLDGLLSQVIPDLHWDDSAANGRGAFVYRDSSFSSGFSSPTQTSRLRTRLDGTSVSATVTPEIADASILETKLSRAEKEGAFLVLMVSPKRYNDAEAEFARRFRVTPYNIDKLLISAMREEARAASVDWNVVLRADASSRDSRDWHHLTTLIGRSIRKIEGQIATSEQTVLLLYPGLLARYGRLDLLERLRDEIGVAGSRLHGVWILVAADEQSERPTLNGVTIPVITPGQWARVTDAWLDLHRHL